MGDLVEARLAVEVEADDEDFEDQREAVAEELDIEKGHITDTAKVTNE